jgi:hypothetical protein
MKTKLSLLAALAIAAVAAVPSPAAAKTSPCRAALKAKGVHVVTRSASSVVFYRGDKPYPYGCHLTKSKKVHLLEICCAEEHFKLRGRYLGYTYRGSADGDETDRVGVYDLVSGKQKKIDGEVEVDHQNYIPSFVVTSKGGLAWFEELADENGETGVTEVHAVGPGSSTNRLLDSGPKMTKLKLSADELTVSWLNDGAAMSAPLTP